MRVTLLQESRADAGIYAPLIAAMEQDSRFNLTVIQHTRDHTFKPDWLIVLGDRRPMLEATIEAAYAGVPIAHIQGGDRSGTIDEPCRHAITRFANLHFPCTQVSADRIVRMGEEPWRIKVVGPLGIYAMPETKYFTKEEICKILALDASREIVLVLQHPVSTQVKEAGWQMMETMKATEGWQTVVIYPNSDPGSEAMVCEIELWKKAHKFKNLPYLQFISLLKCCDVVVGNSSTGLYEAPLFGVLAVNIGTRQQDREQGANIATCDHNAHHIRLLVELCLRGGKCDYGRNPFKVDVDGVKIIMDTLAGTPIDERLLQKKVTY